MKIIAADRLRSFVAEIFRAIGCSAAEGERIGRYLVAANLTGHDSHGVVRVPRYVQMKRDKAIYPDVTVDVLTDLPALAVVDGKFGFGQTVAPQAVEIGIAKAKQGGLAAVALRNAGHIGRIGDWAEMAAAAKLISIHFVNAAGSVLVAPFGAAERRISTAPYCIGVPLPGRAPLLLDFATSVVAEGKVLVASQGGKPVPADALIGPDGQLSNDPHTLYGPFEPLGPRDAGKGQGAIRAFGEHKGSGLAILCEVLGGALSGNGCTEFGRPFANGMFSIYVDPARFDASDFFSTEVQRYIDFVKSAKPAKAGQDVLVPGEMEERTRQARLRDGIPLADDTWAAIVASAKSAGLDEPRIVAT